MKTQYSFLVLTLLFLATTFSLQAQTLNPTLNISAAGTADTFKGGYTFAYATSGTPWNGALISFGGFSNQYDCQISTDYGTNGGNNFSFRTRNGDVGTWNSWFELATRGVNTFTGNQTINGNLNILGTTNKIVGFGDAANYYIGTYPVTGSSGLDLHWYGGIRFGDYTSPNVMQITNGKVGVGTATPDAPLTVYGASNFYPARIGSGDARQFSIKPTFTNPSFINNDYPVILATGGGNQPLILDVSRVGIGTTTPSAKLHINNGDNSYGAILATSTGNPFALYTKSLVVQPADVESFRIGMKYDTDERNGFISFYRGGDTFGGFLGFSTNGVERMRLDRSGNVGIGTTIPDAKLTVNGTVHATEVKVTVSVPADYVFQKYYTGASSLKADYVMPTLQEVAQYTQANHHLPNIPAAQDQQANGVNLGEMNNLLLQKIEELTLYAIEQQKKMDAMAARLSRLEK